MWLISKQIVLIAVGGNHENYTEKVSKLLEKSEIRATYDTRNETVGKKIRDAEQMKIPFMGIIGDKEIENEIISVRAHGGKIIGEMKINELVDYIKKEEKKSYN